MIIDFIYGQGGGSGNAGELKPVTSFPADAQEGTVVALASGDTVGVYQYDGTDWIQIGTGGGNVVELTRAQYDALANPDSGTTYIITDAPAVDLDDYAMASGLTELSSSTSTALATKADKQNVTANTGFLYFPTWNNQGVITGNGTRAHIGNIGFNGSAFGIYKQTSGTAGYFYAPTSKGTAGQVLQSPSSGEEPTWSAYKFAFMTQTAYDALTTKDTTTIYFITGN